MNLRATPETKFLLKYLIIGLGCLGFAGYSFYDGVFAYPARIPRAKAWSELKANVESNPELGDKELAELWKGVAKENGWSAKRPKKDESVESIENLILYQYVFMAIGLGIGLPCTIWYFRARNSWIESTEDGLRSSNGTYLKLSQIEQFDKKKWEKKGIGVLTYRAEDGSTQKFIVDDLKYDRKTTDEIVRWIESKIPAEMIVNGPPEPTSNDTPADADAQVDEDQDENTDDETRD